MTAIERELLKAEVVKVIDTTFTAAVRSTLASIRDAVGKAAIITGKDHLTIQEIHNILDAALAVDITAGID